MTDESPENRSSDDSPEAPRLDGDEGAGLAERTTPQTTPTPFSSVTRAGGVRTAAAATDADSSVGAHAASGVDRGRRAAYWSLAGFFVLGLFLIVRTPRPEPPAATAVEATRSAVLTHADVGGSAPSVTRPAVERDASSNAPAPVPAPVEPVKFTPTWRVASLEHDSALEVVKGTLGKRTLAEALAEVGVPKVDARVVMRALEDVRRISRPSPKDTFVLARDRGRGTVVAFEYIVSPTDIWQAKLDESSGASAAVGRLVSKKLDLFVEQRRKQVAVVVGPDLTKSVVTAGLREEALASIEDAFEGYGEAGAVHPGVRLRVAATEEWVEGVFARFHVDAIELVPRGNGNPLRVYYYERAPGEGNRRNVPHAGFYDAKAQQPFQGAFRSPLPLVRVSSRFNPKRMHPVLHVVTPHNGVDFRATTGTPVYASATGMVSTVGDGGPCGHMVQIDHAGGLTTAYCHLSRFAAGLHVGQKVEPRQLVGYVGQSGRATGPHLHFAVKRRGMFIDPMGLKMDGVRALPPSDREIFAKRRAELDAALDAVVLPSIEGVVVDDKDDKDELHGEE